MLSWPPDGSVLNGQWIGNPSLDGLFPDKNKLLLVVGKTHRTGVIVLIDNRLWWCPSNALKPLVTQDKDE